MPTRPSETAPQRIVIEVQNDGARPHHAVHAKSHKLAVFVCAVGGLVLLLRTQGKTLRNDWTPVGIGVKFVLVLSVASIAILPYELFIKGPSATDKALRY